MSRVLVRGLMAASVAMLAIPVATPASAQATRTWVSGVGDDVNPCSRTAPCKTFAGAISKTAAGGEINCLDPAGFGAVTITKSISLICDGVLNGILASGSNGINVNAGATDTVVLSGFDLEGFGSGINGVRFNSGASLHIRNSTIRGFRGASGFGVNFQPATLTGSTLTLDNVTIINNGATNGVTGGVLIQPGINVAATVLISDSSIADNNRAGIRVDASNTGSSVKATIANTDMVDSQIGLHVRSVDGGGTANVVLFNSVVSSNASSGVIAENALATVNASGSTVTQNGNGLRALTGGNLVSFGGNVVASNNNNGAFTATSAKQ